MFTLCAAQALPGRGQERCNQQREDRQAPRRLQGAQEHRPRHVLAGILEHDAWAKKPLDLRDLLCVACIPLYTLDGIRIFKGAEVYLGTFSSLDNIASDLVPNPVRSHIRAMRLDPAAVSFFPIDFSPMLTLGDWEARVLEVIKAIEPTAAGATPKLQWSAQDELTALPRQCRSPAQRCQEAWCGRVMDGGGKGGGGCFI